MLLFEQGQRRAKFKQVQRERTTRAGRTVEDELQQR